MVFNSIEFLIFFPAVTLIFFVIPGKFKSLWLLIASYYFYMSWNPKYAVLIASSTLITYFSGLFISMVNSNNRFSDRRRRIIKNCILAFSLIFNLGLLILFKYANFILGNLYVVLSALGFSTTPTTLDLLLPVGISFYTFQALSYTFDVYNDRIQAEKNVLRYALFVSFFPQLVAGPIERSSHLLNQFKELERRTFFSYERVRGGLLIMMWGLFQKLVIADRAALLVNAVYNNHTTANLLTITLATICFAFQVYCDFDGYTNIARGAAKVLGIDLIKNFKQPYLAVNIQDFWRRWHISLTTWFTDYLYIPLGGNRKGLLRQMVNVFIVFTVSGLWHGASWNYVIWGMLHALYQCTGILKRKLTGTNSATKLSLAAKVPKIIITFALTCFAWIFFRATDFSNAIAIIRQMITNPALTLTGDLGMNALNGIILCVAILILFIVDLCHEKNISLSEFIFNRNKAIRWCIYLILIWSVIMLGIHGVAYTTSQFIYFQF